MLILSICERLKCSILKNQYRANLPKGRDAKPKGSNARFPQGNRYDSRLHASFREKEHFSCLLGFVKRQLFAFWRECSGFLWVEEETLNRTRPCKRKSGESEEGQGGCAGKKWATMVTKRAI